MSIQEAAHQPPDRPPRPTDDEALESRVLWKVTLRLIPFLFLLYVLNILDRVNVGFARLDMLADMQLSKEAGERVYGLGVGVFFLGYFLFEVPSNLLLKRMGARRWISRILVSWGLISAGMMFVTAPWNFYLLRFLLGLAEAGFFPGIILYLSYWFPARLRARAVARFMTGSAVSSMVGLPLSGAIMQYMHDVLGLAGWQWLFLLEGLPSALLGIVVLYYLTDRPEHAHWLTPAERTWLAQRMRQEEQYREHQHGFTLAQAIANPGVWLLCLVYFTVSMGANSYGAFVPTILEESFRPISKFKIGLLGAIPSTVTIVAMVLIGKHSDHTGERRWHVALPAFVAAAGWIMVTQLPAPYVLLGLMLAQAGMLSMLAPFWSLPTSFLSGAAAAGGIAMINSVGNLGGFVAANVIGQVKAETHSFSGGLMFLAVALVGGGLLALVVRHDATLDRVHQTR
jgi:ACS family tartrate transporter-like MFS transporter